MKVNKIQQLIRLLAALLILVCVPESVLACATCGCSEVCPIAMMETNGTTGKTSSILTDSIWGNIILKMAFQRDPQLQKLTKHLGWSNFGTASSIGVIAAGTMAQNIVSLYTLNQPDGLEDSYVPGSIGLGLDGATNIAFSARLLLNYGYRKKINARKVAIRKTVETILEHLEYSRTECPEAQQQLSELIGERAAKDCMQLWQSSHVMAQLIPQKSPVEEPGKTLETAMREQLQAKPGL